MKKSNYENIAIAYDKLRPDYPEALFKTIVERVGLGKHSSLLEIGPGTGKSTLGLIEHSKSVDCIEIERSMAELLKIKTEMYDVNIHISSFEEWQCHDKKYDFIYSAQAFHWIDKDIKYRKCYELLNKDGKIGLIWYVSVLESDGIYDEINEVFRKYNTGFSSTKPSLIKHAFDRERNELEENGYFKYFDEYSFIGETISQSTDTFISRFNTTSAFETMDDEDKKSVNLELRDVIDGHGGTVNSSVHYILFIGSPVST